MKYANEVCRRFWAKVEIDSPQRCWTFTGATSGNGYGKIKVHGKFISAHRAAWEISFFEVPEGFVVCHACDNRLCCNPDHLMLGKQSANVLDAHKKGRITYSSPVGQNHHNSKLTENDVQAIRRAYDYGEATQTQLAESYQVTQGLVGQIVRRQAWKHI